MAKQINKAFTRMSELAGIKEIITSEEETLINESKKMTKSQLAEVIKKETKKMLKEEDVDEGAGWDACVKKVMDQGKSKEAADKICGSINAKYVGNYRKENQELEEKKEPESEKKETSKKEEAPTDDTLNLDITDNDIKEPKPEASAADETTSKEILDSLHDAFNKAKVLKDKKLSTQIANTITFFTKEHLLDIKNI